jgi:lysozyme
MGPVEVMTPARKMQLIFAACAAAIAGTVASEGWVLKGYPDPVVGRALPTACAGVTEGVVLGRVYTEAECAQMTMLAKVKHAAPLAPCIEREMPPAFLGTMIDTAYNIGTNGFLKSSMCKHMRAGDYPAACDALLLYQYAAGRECSIRANNCYGVWLRRQEKRAECRRALNGSR